jgi:NitT/TauT family transport system ATP-binding protein
VTVLFVTPDIDESIYLGERVIILSSSPTVVQEDIVIDLPAERDQLNTRALPRFTELRHHVYEQIHSPRKDTAPRPSPPRPPRAPDPSGHKRTPRRGVPRRGVLLTVSYLPVGQQGIST